MQYLIHSSILLAGLAAFYWIFLRKETFYKLNRWIFLSGILACLILPLISVPAEMSLRKSQESFAEVVTAPILQIEEVPDASNKAKGDLKKDKAETEVATATNKAFSWQSALMWIYFIGAAIFFLVFLMQLIVLLVRTQSLKSMKTGRYKLVELVKNEEPHSFLNSIFINPESYDQNTYMHIFEHEKVHVDQRHFIDKLIAEFLIVTFWFNPFVWWLRSSLSKNLEFLTDESLLAQGLEKESYQLSLLKVSTSKKPFNLTNSYNNSFLKNRIIMMNSKKSSIISSWKYLFILPLFTFSLLFLNAVIPSNQVNSQTPAKVNQTEVTKDSSKEPVQKFNQEFHKEKENHKEIESAKEQHVTTNSKFKLIELDLPNIHSFSASNNVHVELSLGNQQKITVEGPQYLLDELNQEVNNGEWAIKFKNKKTEYKKGDYLKINLGLTSLQKVGISGVANITAKEKIIVKENVILACSGVGNMKMHLEARKIHCAVSGSGNIQLLGGKSDKLVIQLSGSGNILGRKFYTQEADMHISGAGHIAVNVEETLDAVISGSGIIEYGGNPKIHKSMSGSGNIFRM